MLNLNFSIENEGSHLLNKMKNKCCWQHICQTEHRRFWHVDMTTFISEQDDTITLNEQLWWDRTLLNKMRDHTYLIQDARSHLLNKMTDHTCLNKMTDHTCWTTLVEQDEGSHLLNKMTDHLLNKIDGSQHWSLNNMTDHTCWHQWMTDHTCWNASLLTDHNLFDTRWRITLVWLTRWRITLVEQDEGSHLLNKMRAITLVKYNKMRCCWTTDDGSHLLNKMTDHMLNKMTDHTRLNKMTPWHQWIITMATPLVLNKMTDHTYLNKMTDHTCWTHRWGITLAWTRWGITLVEQDEEKFQISHLLKNTVLLTTHMSNSITRFWHLLNKMTDHTWSLNKMTDHTCWTSDG